MKQKTREKEKRYLMKTKDIPSLERKKSDVEIILFFSLIERISLITERNRSRNNEKKKKGKNNKK